MTRKATATKAVPEKKEVEEKSATKTVNYVEDATTGMLYAGDVSEELVKVLRSGGGRTTYATTRTVRVNEFGDTKTVWYPADEVIGYRPGEHRNVKLVSVKEGDDE